MVSEDIEKNGLRDSTETVIPGAYNFSEKRERLFSFSYSSSFSFSNSQNISFIFSIKPKEKDVKNPKASVSKYKII